MEEVFEKELHGKKTCTKIIDVFAIEKNLKKKLHYLAQGKYEIVLVEAFNGGAEVCFTFLHLPVIFVN